jgi:hypothetical protein
LKNGRDRFPCLSRRSSSNHTLARISQQAVARVKQAKTDPIAKLEAQQTRLIRLHVEEGDDASPDAFRERLRMQAEIKAAELSLAETEQRLQLDADMLRMALELAEDVAAVYATADERTKRGYNQAFFTKLFVTPEWDDEQQLVVRIRRTGLTEPYQELLAEDLVATITNEVDLIRRAAVQAEDGPSEPPSGAGCSIFVKLAERAGRRANLEATLDRLLEALLEPVGREARRRAAAAIRRSA